MITLNLLILQLELNRVSKFWESKEWTRNINMKITLEYGLNRSSSLLQNVKDDD